MLSTEGSWNALSHLQQYRFSLSYNGVQFSSVQSLSRVDSLRPHESQHARPPCPITNSRSSLRLKSIKSVMPSSHLILCRPLLLLPPIPPSIRVFSNESTLRMRWPKYWSFSFSIIPSKEHPGLTQPQIKPFQKCNKVHIMDLEIQEKPLKTANIKSLKDKDRVVLASWYWSKAHSAVYKYSWEGLKRHQRTPIA